MKVESITLTVERLEGLMTLAFEQVRLPPNYNLVSSAESLFHKS